MDDNNCYHYSDEYIDIINNLSAINMYKVPKIYRYRLKEYLI